MSLDAKATVAIGEFSRGGKSRVEVKALDHDFKPLQKVTPFGIYLPEHDRLFIYILESRVTADAIADCLCDCWETIKAEFPKVESLLLNLDNGPENHSRRTQFMKRLTQFVDEYELEVGLAYYPPYHSKYNPVERVWGVLEQHWNGCLLDTLKAVMESAKTMTYKGVHPVVKQITKVYKTGVKLTASGMRELEKRLVRLQGLGKYFLNIPLLS